MRIKIDFKLLLITDRKQTKKPLTKVIEAACKSGIRAVQLREKDLSSKDLLQLAKRLRTVTQKYNTKLLINDRLDVAMLSKADGIHLPENGTLIKYMKRFGNELLFGRSVHSVEGAAKAEKEDYDYVIYGPVFKTRSKIRYGRPKGIRELKKVSESVGLPVFAVGGITPKRARRCIKSGAYGVAVIGAIMRSQNPKKTIYEFRQVLGEL